MSIPGTRSVSHSMSGYQGVHCSLSRSKTWVQSDEGFVKVGRTLKVSTVMVQPPPPPHDNDSPESGPLSRCLYDVSRTHRPLTVSLGVETGLKSFRPRDPPLGPLDPWWSRGSI